MDVEECLKRLVPMLPSAIGVRFTSAFQHIDRAKTLLPLDREMASFRAITGEEEAATALMMAIQSKRYLGADKFKAWNHQHKAAVIACVMAISRTLLPLLREYKLTFNFEKCRIDVNFPLSSFGVKGGEGYGLQLVEPLGLLHSRPETSADDAFHDALKNLAEGQGFEDVRQLIAAQANARNTLLYASDTKLPESQATPEVLENRKNRALILLSLAVTVLQAKPHQPMVTQAIPAFLRVIGKAEGAA